jgi:uncharacterized heparinase superfamily protein
MVDAVLDDVAALVAPPETAAAETAAPPPPADDSIEPGKRLIRLPADRGLSLGDRISNHFYRLTWRTPLHALRLKGRFPLKLLGVPEDPLPGDARAGKAIRAGWFLNRGFKLPLADLDFERLTVVAPFADYLHSFGWLRDLAAAGAHGEAAGIAEPIVRQWLAVHGETVTEPAWRADNSGWRILNWAAHAPMILSSGDLVYRSAVLNHIARAARHLDRVADKSRIGIPQLVAWSGIVAASLLIPGGEQRQIFGEAGLRKAIESTFYADGGTISRAPHAQLDAILVLSMLERVYAMRRLDTPPFLRELLARAVPALLGLRHGDGGLGSWQGSGATSGARVEAIVAASGVRARPLKQARDWGYQRITAGAAVVLVDAAPPPVARITEAGCASTLAFELSDGPTRIVVNCGGAALTGATIPSELSNGLRTTAAHSTLTIADTNSTAILPSGTLGKGVTEVELDRRETDQGSRLEVSHDGYAKRHGLIHRRLFILTPTGKELRGEDMLLPAPRSRHKNESAYAIRFHMGPGISASLTADKQGALLRIAEGPLWQFRTSDGLLSIEDSLWVDGDGRPHPIEQLVVSGNAPAGGASIGWLFKHIG